MLVVVAVVVGLVVGGCAMLLGLRLMAGSRLEGARRERALLLEEARHDAD